MALTLSAFADRTGYHFTTASRLKNGQRLPSREMVSRLAEEFELTDEQVGDWLQAITDGGREGSGRWVTKHIFGE